MVPPDRVSFLRGGLGPVLAWLLVLLLTVTTPLGLVDHAHQGQLLDPLFPHPHLGHQHSAAATTDLANDAPRTARATDLNWPALERGTAAGSDATAGVGLVPLPVSGDIWFRVDEAQQRWVPDLRPLIDWIAPLDVPPPRANG